MAGHRVLNGVAAGLLGSFIGRNNDIDGYWAIGKLCRFAVAEELRSVTIGLHPSPDLSTQQPSLPEVFAFRFQKSFAKRVELAGFPLAHVARAEVTISFADLPPRSPIGSTEGTFDCTVSIFDLQGRMHSASASGRCRPHDPSFEQRSLRSDWTEHPSWWRRLFSRFGGMKSRMT